MEVVTGTIFLFGLFTSTLLIKNEFFSFMGNTSTVPFYNFQNTYNVFKLKTILEIIITSMISIKDIDKKEFELCYELDANTICLWTKKQWQCEFNKIGVKAFGILSRNEIIGICVVQIIIDEAQLNYFSIKQEFRRKGYGTHLMTYLIKECEKLNIKRLLLEVSETNLIAEVFYSRFNFLTVGKRNKYYKDGSNAVLKEKKITK